MALALVALVACLASCGGGDDEPAGSNGSTTATSGDEAGAGGATGDAPTSEEGTSDDDESASDESGDDAGDSESEGEPSGGSSDESSAESPYGEVSPRSATFDEKGRVLKHLPEFGDEASDGERDAAQAVLRTYLQASGGDEWAKACQYVSATLKVEAEQIAKQSEKLRNEGCGAALRFLANAVSLSKFPDYNATTVTSMRIKKGDTAGAGAGFALIHGSDGKDYWVAMRNEGGEWRVMTLVPQPFR